MAGKRVTAVQRMTKDDPALSQITHIGGNDFNDGAPWRMSREDAIKLIRSFPKSFYVLEPDLSHAFLEVVEEKGIEPYLRTPLRSSRDSGLTSLPDAPDSWELIKG